MGVGVGGQYFPSRFGRLAGRLPELAVPEIAGMTADSRSRAFHWRCVRLFFGSHSKVHFFARSKKFGSTTLTARRLAVLRKRAGGNAKAVLPFFGQHVRGLLSTKSRQGTALRNERARTVAAQRGRRSYVLQVKKHAPVEVAGMPCGACHQPTNLDIGDGFGFGPVARVFFGGVWGIGLRLRRQAVARG